MRLHSAVKRSIRINLNLSKLSGSGIIAVHFSLCPIKQADLDYNLNMCVLK